MSGERESAALLPCPFCGSTDLSVETYSIQPDDYHGGYVTCTNCDAHGAGAISLNGWLSNKPESHSAAIAAWNTRPDVDREREAMREAAAKVADGWAEHFAGRDGEGRQMERVCDDIALLIRNLPITKGSQG